MVNKQVTTVSPWSTILLGTCWETEKLYHQTILLEETGEARVQLLILYHILLKFYTSQLRDALQSLWHQQYSHTTSSGAKESSEAEKLQVMVS